MKQTWTGALIAAGLLLAGCTNGGATDPTGSTSTTPSTPASTSPATTAPPTSSPEDTAAAQAEEVLRAYYRAQTKCFAEPTKALPTCFDGVAIGTELKNMRNALGGAQQMQTKASGDIGLLSVKPTKVDLTNKVNETPPTVPTVLFAVCLDVSKYNIVDKDGKSIVPPTRKPHVPVSVSVYNYKLPDPAQWRVGYIEEVKDSSC